MSSREDAQQAKEFLISKVLEEVQLEGTPMSEVEWKMLYFTETHESLPDMPEISEKFDQEYDRDEYEKKIARLIRNAYERDCTSGEGADRWKQARSALRGEDHYVLVMVGQAFGSLRSPHDRLKLIATAIAIVAGFFLLSWLGWIPNWFWDLPGRAAGLVILAVGGLLWLLVSERGRQSAGDLFEAILAAVGWKRSQKGPDG